MLRACAVREWRVLTLRPRTCTRTGHLLAHVGDACGSSCVASIRGCTLALCGDRALPCALCLARVSLRPQIIPRAGSVRAHGRRRRTPSDLAGEGDLADESPIRREPTVASRPADQLRLIVESRGAERSENPPSTYVRRGPSG